MKTKIKPPKNTKICKNGKIYINNGNLSEHILEHGSWVNGIFYNINYDDYYTKNHYKKDMPLLVKLSFLNPIIIIILLYNLKDYNNLPQTTISTYFLLMLFFFIMTFIAFLDKKHYDRIFVKNMIIFYEIEIEKNQYKKELVMKNNSLKLYEETQNLRDEKNIYFTICPYCGAGCDNNDKICEYCGTSLLFNSTHENTTNITKHDVDEELLKETKIRNEKFRKDLEIVKKYRKHIKGKKIDY